MPQIKRVIDTCLSQLSDKKILIPLSGGLDSNSILFSCAERNLDCVAVSFRMDSHESRDFKTARANANALGVDFHEIVLSSHVEDIKRDLVYAARDLNCKKKTELECIRPMIHLYKVAKELGASVIVSGLGAENVYLETKKAVINYKKTPDLYREMMREKVLLRDSVQLRQHDILCELHNIEHVMPYIVDDMFDTFMGVSWESCMKGTSKRPAKEQYSSFLSREDIKVFAPQGYQLGDTGIGESFKCLLNSDWNIRSVTNVIAIYNDLIAGRLDKIIGE